MVPDFSAGTVEASFDETVSEILDSTTFLMIAEATLTETGHLVTGVSVIVHDFTVTNFAVPGTDSFTIATFTYRTLEISVTSVVQLSEVFPDYSF